jgi:hypothetical protein
LPVVASSARTWAFAVTDEDLPLRHRDPAVHVAAAQRHVEGDGVLVPPDLGAVLRVSAHTQPSSRPEHDPVDDDRVASNE